jgi:cobalt-zinc-cadmium efflux system outer membrane protein
MRRRWLFLMVLAAGCQTSRPDLLGNAIPSPAIPPVPPVAEVTPCAAPAVPPAEVVGLPELWDLALRHNPQLREAAARVENARGRQIQAAKYPNPQFTFEEEDLGTSRAPAGTIRFQLSQEIITGGKRQLDQAVARRGTDAAALALRGQHYDVLTRVRHAYVEYLGHYYTVRVNEATVRALTEGKEITRRLVEVVQSRPRTDLLRLEALLEEARINRQRSRINLQAAWRQLGADVGVPDLPVPARLRDLPAPPRGWDLAAVRQRVLSDNTEVQQAAVEVEQRRLALERARAEVVPNVTVGGGYSRNYAENEAGAVISLQTRLPLWDRNQGRILSAQAALMRSRAALQTVTNRLSRDTAEAFARYQSSRQELERLRASVLPRLGQSLQLIQQGYQTGSAQVTFADVLSAQQSLNEAQLHVARARRDCWRAVADLEGLMQLDLGEEFAVTPCQADPSGAGRAAPPGSKRSWLP